ncbi:hypothetical protein [Paraburkholderia bannensis]|uniref:hypothetical protein n=1 Tax=Paraburkholderia bannensis TaxID=765414 RepID=UPI002AB7C122|nr:hypothetical protein [Paraburkholderia bannensis]
MKINDHAETFYQDGRVEQSRPDTKPVVCLVANRAVGTGKSTIASCLLALPLNATIYALDSVMRLAPALNGVAVKKHSPDTMVEMRNEIAKAQRNTVVDVGASYFSAFLENPFTIDFIKIVDICVIVTDTTHRGQEESIATYTTLKDLGMEDRQFRLVLNRARSFPAREQYEILFDYAEKNPSFVMNDKCLIPETDLFCGIDKNGQGFLEALEDHEDYKPLIKRAKDDREKDAVDDLISRQINHRMAMGILCHFEECFKSLNIPSHLRVSVAQLA